MLNVDFIYIKKATQDLQQKVYRFLMWPSEVLKKFKVKEKAQMWEK